MKKILIVDDDFFDEMTPLGEHIFKVVKSKGIHIDGINNASKAVELLKTAKYDLVLMDGEFEKQFLQGPEAVTRIREFSSVPIIMISGSKKLNGRGMTEGATAFFDDKGYIAKDVKDDNGKIATLLRDGTDYDSCHKTFEKEKIRAKISNLLLTIDIDMQTLSILRNEQSDKVAEFLKETYDDNIDYRQKLDNLRAFAADESKNAEIHNLCHAESVREFFNKLAQKTMDAESLLNHDWKLESINSFSNWFAAVMAALE